MDATREIRRCRRDADNRRYQAAELESRADALEARDRVYREAMAKRDYPITDEPSVLQKVRTVVSRLRAEA